MAGAAIPLILGGVSAAASVGGGAIAAHGAKKASQAQIDASAIARAGLDKNFAEQKARFEPYRQTGLNALSMLNGGQFGGGQVANQQSMQQTGQTLGQLGSPQSYQPQSAADPIVSVQAPNGGPTKDMPLSQARLFEARGAKILNAPGGFRPFAAQPFSQGGQPENG